VTKSKTVISVSSSSHVNNLNTSYLCQDGMALLTNYTTSKGGASNKMVNSLDAFKKAFG